MRCSNCGAELPDGSKFCGFCGKVQQNKPEPAPAQKNNALKIVIPIVTATVTLAIIAVVLVLLFIGPRKPQTNELPGLSQGDNAVVEQETEEADSPLPQTNPYHVCFTTEDAFLLPESHCAYLNHSHIGDFSEQQLEIARQELYARYGCAFSDPDVQAYFDAHTWYENTGASATLNEFEKANEVLLQVQIARLEGSLQTKNNPYIQEHAAAEGYLIPGSDSRYLGAADLKNLSAVQLEAARSELFARHGYIFSHEQLREYFYSKQWYVPSVPGNDFDDEVFNDFESNNLEMIQIYERRKGGVRFSSDNPNAPYFDSSSSYLIPDSNTRELNWEDAFRLDERQCVIARNEIFARHGYTFENEPLLEYFLQKTWYEPNLPVGKNENVNLSSIESKNVEFLLEAENIYAGVAKFKNPDRTMNVTVKDEMFSFRVPAYWKDAAVFDSKDPSKIYEKYSHNSKLEMGDGFIVNIDAYPAEGFEGHPIGRTLGLLTADNGQQWYLVTYGPTDVRFHPAARDLNSMMGADVDLIYDTITPAPGYTYTAF